MLTSIVREKLREQFSDLDIQFGGTDTDIIATIVPVHASWKPIVVCDDGDEVTVYFGDFTHVHYGHRSAGGLTRGKAVSIADDVVGELGLVFADQIEGFRYWGYFGAGGLRRRGSQGVLSKLIFGANGRSWSGNTHR